jgi:hypothetical protein
LGDCGAHDLIDGHQGRSPGKRGALQLYVPSRTRRRDAVLNDGEDG